MSETRDRCTEPRRRAPRENEQRRNDGNVAPATTDQIKLWRRYLEQQARRSCPGCGEDDVVL